MRDPDPGALMTRKPKRKRRVKYGAEEPLVMSGTVVREVERPAPSRPWVPALRALVNGLPSHAETRRGRETAVFIRLIIGVAAVMMVTKGKSHWGWGLAGVLTAMSSIVIPLGETRQRRWIRRLEALLLPTTAMEPRPAELTYDGRKASMRVDGRVWRSLRPFDPPGTTRILQIDDVLWLGVIPPEGRKRDPLWFFTPATPALCEQLSGVESAEVPPDVGMALGGDDFLAAHGAFRHRL